MNTFSKSWQRGGRQCANICLALILNIGLPTVSAMPYQAYILAGHARLPVGIDRLDQWNVRRTYVQRRLDPPALACHPPTLGFAGRMGGEWKFIPDCLLFTLRSLSRFVFRTQRRPVGVRVLLCRRPTETMLSDLHVLAAPSLTFCSVGGFIGRAKPGALCLKGRLEMTFLLAAVYCRFYGWCCVPTANQHITNVCVRIHF